MEDKILKLRNEHPILDFIAGFIPGVGEAQDVQDFAHASSKGDVIGMGLASLGLIIPGLTGGQIGKTLKLAKKVDVDDVGGGLVNAVNKSIPAKELARRKEFEEGLLVRFPDIWKRVDGKMYNTKTQRFYDYDNTNHFTNVESIENVIKCKETYAKNLSKSAKQIEKEFNADTNTFENISGLDFSLTNWKQLGGGHVITKAEQKAYMERAYPQFKNTWKELVTNGVKNEQGPKLKKMKDEKGHEYYYGWFDDVAFPQLGEDYGLNKIYHKGYRKLSDKEAMVYVIAHSPQAQGKFIYNGVPMNMGVPLKYKNDFENAAGKLKQKFFKWFSSDYKSPSYYSNPENKGFGLYVHGLPLITPQSKNFYTVDISKVVNPTSTSVNGIPIHEYISNTSGVGQTNNYILDTTASGKIGAQTKGIFTVAGEDVPVKSLFGGSGLYEIEGDKFYIPYAKKGRILIKNK